MAAAGDDSRASRSLDLPIDATLLFSDHKNRYDLHLEKRQTRLLRALGFLKPFLLPEERILFVTVAYSPAPLLEQLLTGWLYFCLRRCLLVFTNKSIWHIPIQLDRSPRQVVAQIRYPDCQNIFIKGKNLVVHYHQGESEEFVVTAKKQKIESILSAVPWQGISRSTPRRIHLCPRCGEELLPEALTCAHCRLGFKNKTTARQIAVFCPGGAFFYSRHLWIGLGAAMVELALLTLAGMSLTEVLHGSTPSLATLFFAVGAFLGVKAVSVYLAARLVDEPIPVPRKLAAKDH